MGLILSPVIPVDSTVVWLRPLMPGMGLWIELVILDVASLLLVMLLMCDLGV